MKKKIFTAIHIIILLLIALILTAGIYSKIEFKMESMEEFYFYATNGIGNSDNSMVFYAILHYSPLYILISMILICIFYNPFKIKNCKFYPFKHIINHKNLYTLIFGLIIVFIASELVKTRSYIYQNIKKSKFFENNYVEVIKDDINFEKDKKNLVMIFIESLETTFFDKKNGGDWNKNIIPELDEIRKMDEAEYFSTDKKGKGTDNLYGTTYTTASVIANNSTIPFKTPILYNDFNKKTYFNNVYTLGDALEDNGYHNEVISTAQLAFGALDDFFVRHGHYKIYDPDTLESNNIRLKKENLGKWGFNDKFMFELAKTRITELSNSDQPFNITMIGIDTHPMDGFKGSYTSNEFKNQYENVYATESKLIKEFIDWFKEQPSYDDTVTVIIGDHLCMQSNFIGNHKLNKRGRYNVIINSSVKSDNKFNRSFTAVDTTPTILASLGATINGDRMGLGTNLYSDKKTITEEYGLDYVNKELKNASDMYIDLITEK